MTKKSVSQDTNASMIRKFAKRNITKRQFLEEVKQRLENEVGTYLHCLERRGIEDRNAQAVGFWAGIRLLMPVIDALSEVLIRSNRGDQRPKPVRFMDTYLGIQYPFLIWEIYRHSLIHGDLPRWVKYRGHQISWGLQIGPTGVGHDYWPDRINLDITKLYEDLLSFLNREVHVANGNVYQEIGVRFGNGIQPMLKEEFRRIRQEPPITP